MALSSPEKDDLDIIQVYIQDDIDLSLSVPSVLAPYAVQLWIVASVAIPTFYSVTSATVVCWYGNMQPSCLHQFECQLHSVVQRSNLQRYSGRFVRK